MNPSVEQLLRLLRLIPLAARPEGIGVEEAARLCDVDPEVVNADFRLLADRSWYLPPGRADDFQIAVQADRIQVHAPFAFQRPVRLGIHECLAVSLALRCAGVEREEARELCRALEAACALEPDPARSDRGDEAVAMPLGEEPVEVVLRRSDSDAVHDELALAIVHRRQVRLGYLKPDARVPEERRMEPWHLLHAEGETYLLAFDLDRGAPRLFRLDRILAVRTTDVESTHEVTLDGAAVDGGGFVRWEAAGSPPEPTVAEVRYSPRVARWVRERFPGVEEEDGGYRVEHHVMNDHWLVSHVLRFGTEAEVLAPERLREEVVRRVVVGKTEV